MIHEAAVGRCARARTLAPKSKFLRSLLRPTAVATCDREAPNNLVETFGCIRTLIKHVLNCGIEEGLCLVYGCACLQFSWL